MSAITISVLDKRPEWLLQLSAKWRCNILQKCFEIFPKRSCKKHALNSVVSNIFGKSATSVIDYLLKQPDNSSIHEEISSRLLRSLKSVLESIEGYQMTDAQKYRMRLVHAHVDYNTFTISNIDSMINSLVEPYENAVHLLCIIPGVDRSSAITIISEISTDMTQFSNSKRLCCWADSR